MYQASAPRFTHMLKNLSAILAKAQAHCEARKIDPLVLTGSRLYPDMFPLSRQVQVACDAAKGAVARLAGVEIPKHEDTEQSFAELQARIAKTLEFIASVKPAQIDGSEDKEIVLKLRGQGHVSFKGSSTCCPSRRRISTSTLQPPTTSCATTAEIGKSDFLGGN
jgi:hypothetical protein